MGWDMHSDDYSDIADLRSRLRHFKTTAGNRLVPIIGAGLSNSVLPNVAQMTQMFRSAMPPDGLDRFDERIGPVLGTALGYQNAAALLRAQAGDATLARVIRSAVLRACDDVQTAGHAEDVAQSIADCEHLDRVGRWRIPEGYSRFARYYASLDGSLRGPVVTTNFDPLIEVALRQAGLPAEAVPIPLDAVPRFEQIGASADLPVLHIHGYWTSNKTLSTIPQLTRERPGLTDFLRKLLRRSTVLVLAYGGWEDAFMRSLAEHAREGSDLLDTEILWAAYEQSADLVLENSTLKSLYGVPGFHLYLGIDGHALFGTDEPAAGLAAKSPYGYTRLPASAGRQQYSPAHFVDGSQPVWADAVAGQWPLLAATEELSRRLATWLRAGGGGGVVAIGPLGEGKSLALRQVALAAAASHPDWTVLWREPGASPLSAEWIKQVHQEYGNILVCADDADLVAADLALSTGMWSERGSGVTFLLASQDRLWWPHGHHLRRLIDDVVFHGFTRQDALGIASAWFRHHLLAGTGADSGADSDAESAVAACAGRLWDSARTSAVANDAENTLFGAILDVRYGPKLAGRVQDLVQKLSLFRIHPEIEVNLGDVFGGICILQDTYDPDGATGRGASRAVIAGMVKLSGEFADGKILTMLGREAAIRYAGDRVYSRHPAIARHAVAYLRAAGRLPDICRLIGQAGGRLRNSGGLQDQEYQEAYLLGRNLSNPTEAEAAGRGAVEGARDLLEPRVMMIGILRRADNRQAYRYAEALGRRRLNRYRDYGSAIRGYLVEYSNVARGAGEVYLGMGLAGLALHRGNGFMLDADRAGYALTALARSAAMVAEQNRKVAAGIAEAAYVLMTRICGPDTAAERLGQVRGSLPDLAAFRSLGAEALCERLGPVLSTAATAAVAETGISFDFKAPIALDDLRRLAAAPPPRPPRAAAHL
jgi:hypothetical protein